MVHCSVTAAAEKVADDFSGNGVAFFSGMDVQVTVRAILRLSVNGEPQIRLAMVTLRPEAQRAVKVHSRLSLLPYVHCLVTEPESTLPPPSRTRPVVRLAIE